MRAQNIQSQNEKAQGDGGVLSMCLNTEQKEVKKIKPLASFSQKPPLQPSHYQNLTIQTQYRVQTEKQGIPLKHKKSLFHFEGSQTLELVAQRGCGVSILGDV